MWPSISWPSFHSKLTVPRRAPACVGNVNVTPSCCSRVLTEPTDTARLAPEAGGTRRSGPDRWSTWNVHPSVVGEAEGRHLRPDPDRVRMALVLQMLTVAHR